jgi:hypothetical protein
MIEKELYELLVRSFDDELNSDEKRKLEKALASSDELRSEKKKIQTMRKIIASKQYSFNTGFKNRIMARLEEEKKPFILKSDFNRTLFSVFKRVALTGVAAIIILLLSIYLSDYSFSLDSFTGSDPYSDDNLVSYLLYEDLND